MGLKYSQAKEIYKRANWLIYDNLYDERSLARDMITAAQQDVQRTRGSYAPQTASLKLIKRG